MNADARQRAKDRYGHHGHGDGRADGQSGTESQVGIGSAENNAEQDAEAYRLDREFGWRFVTRHERIVGFPVGNGHVGLLAQSVFSHDYSGIGSESAADSTRKR